MMELEASNGTQTFQSRVQAGGREAGPGARGSVAQAARDLDVHENQLRKWVRKFTTDPARAFPGQGQLKPEQVEIERLRREAAKLKAERDILKKAAAFFAKEST